MILLYLFFNKKWAKSGLFWFIFVLFSTQWQINIWLKSIDGVLGIRTRDCRMVGADESTELKRPPTVYLFGNLFYLSLPKITLKLAKAFWWSRVSKSPLFTTYLPALPMLCYVMEKINNFRLHSSLSDIKFSWI